MWLPVLLQPANSIPPLSSPFATVCNAEEPMMQLFSFDKYRVTVEIFPAHFVASGASGGNAAEVQILSSALLLVTP